jgi:hypothetical protein
LKLIHLDCSYNRIVRLPLNLREMISLIELNIEHNPLEVPPASVSINDCIEQDEYEQDDGFLGLYTWLAAYHEISTRRSS